MTIRSFQCPACGAPLIPKGMASLITCPYCHTSVVVPAELRQVSGAAAWSVLLFDSFTSNDNNWSVGLQSSKHFTRLDRMITEGRYRWEATVKVASSIARVWLAEYQASDFHLMVNCKHIRGNRAGSAWGVIFRVQDNHNHYWFRMKDSQFFAISVQKESQWVNIVAWTRANAIKPNGVNQLEVIAREAHFIFLINGQVVSEVDDHHFSQGLVGLAIEGFTAGEEIRFDFMDIILRVP